MKRSVLIASLGLSAALAACVGPEGGVEPDVANAFVQAQLRDPGGRVLATSRVVRAEQGLNVLVTSSGLRPGTYAVHVHTTGRCDAPDFTSAGPHWNPTGRQHGPENPQGPHLGDLPNLIVGATGQGSIEYLIRGAQLSGSNTALLDADGAAVVVHAAADDLRTDPSGNSGARIACGVLE